MDAITQFVTKHVASNWLRSGVVAFVLDLVWRFLVIAVKPHGQYGLAAFGWVQDVLQWVAVICLGAYAIQVVTGRSSG